MARTRSSNPARSCTVTLLWHGTVLRNTSVPAGRPFTVGEGGDLALPGMAGVHTVLGPNAAAEVPGWTTHEPGDGGRRLRSDAYPEIELQIIENAPVARWFRTGLFWNPTRELGYGFALAGLLASLIAIPVAVSAPAAAETADEEDSSELVLAMLDVQMPIVVLPPPVTVYLAGRGEDDAAPPAQLEGDDEEPGDPGADLDLTDGDAVLGEVLEAGVATNALESTLAEFDAVTEIPEPTRRREYMRRSKRGRAKDRKLAEELSDKALISVLGTYGDEGGTIANVMSDGGLAGLDNALEEGLITTAGAKDPLPTKLAVPPKSFSRGRGKAEPKPDPLEKGPDCKVRFEPKPQVDIVFVVDLTEGMARSHARLLAQLAAVEKLAREHDESPRYGFVGYAGLVWMSTILASSHTQLSETLSGWFDDPGSYGDGADSDSADLGLDAIYDAATRFDWRDADDTSRIVVFIGGGPFQERGTIRNGVDAERSFQETVAAVEDAGVRVVSFTDSAPGFVSPFGKAEAIPKASGGNAYDLGAFESGRMTLQKVLAEPLRNPVCDRSLLER